MKRIFLIKGLVILGLNLIMISSCQKSVQDISDRSNFSLCDLLDNDSLVTLKGTINITTKGTIVFENIDNRFEWQRKIHLIPCSVYLKDYIFSYYDSYLYLKNFDEKLWVSVEGRYLTPDTLESPQQFLFHWIAIIDEQEAITDSSQALRQNSI